MMLYFFVILFTMCLFALIITYSWNVKQNQLKRMVVVLIFSLAAIGMCLKPKPIYDLTEHYEMIELARRGFHSLVDFLQYVYLIDLNYAFTYVYNILVYVIAHSLPNEALVFITVVSVYGIFYYIFLREFDEKRVNSRNIVLSLTIFSVLLPYLYVYSNIRNPLAAAIIAFGIFKFYKEGNLTILILSAIIAVLIHPVAIVIIPFIFLSKFKPGLKSILATFVLPTIVMPVLEFISTRIDSAALAAFMVKYHNYTMVRDDNQGRIFLFSSVLILLVIFLLFLFSHRRTTNKIDSASDRLVNLMIWYSMFSLGFWQDYSIITRLPYSIACLSPVIVNTLFQRNRLVVPVLQLVTLVGEWMVLALGLLGIYNNIMWLR